MILQDGRQGPMQAIAITVDQARTGVAEDVDNRVLERYGGLIIAGLIQASARSASSSRSSTPRRFWATALRSNRAATSTG